MATVAFRLAADGRVHDIRAARASDEFFATAAMEIVANFECRPVGQDVAVERPIGFQLD